MSRIAKKPIKLSLDASLVEAARARGLDLSAIAEEALRVRIAQEDARRWLAENREAITAQNTWMAERSLFLDELRSW